MTAGAIGLEPAKSLRADLSRVCVLCAEVGTEGSQKLLVTLSIIHFVSDVIKFYSD